jgi:hypothetical protein
MSDVPEDVATLVRDAAKTMPGAFGDTEAVVRRARRYRRRRAGAVVCATVFAILSAVTVPVLVGRAERGVQPAVVPTTPRTSAALAQRLFIGISGDISHERGLPEVRGDGSVVYRDLPAGAGDVVGLPDGRLVTLVTADLQPGTKRKDGPDVEGVSIKLVVLTAGGGVERSREVRIKGEEMRLLGATGRTAYLARATGVVAHDLASGKESVVLPPLGAALFQATDLAGGRLAVAEGNGNKGCILRVTELAGGGKLPPRNFANGTCLPDHVRLSPDGRLAAVAYLRLNSTEKRLAVLDVATGVALVDKPLGSRPVTDVETVNTAGVAWSDNRTVRVAVTELPPGANRVYRLSQVLRVLTVIARL